MRPGWFCNKFRQIWVFGFHKIIPRWKINSIVFAPPCLGVQSWSCPISSNRQMPCDDGCWNSKLFLYRPRTSLMTQTDGGGSPARHLKCPNLVGFGPSLSSSLSQLVWGELSLEIVFLARSVGFYIKLCLFSCWCKSCWWLWGWHGDKCWQGGAHPPVWW